MATHSVNKNVPTPWAATSAPVVKVTSFILMEKHVLVSIISIVVEDFHQDLLVNIGEGSDI